MSEQQQVTTKKLARETPVSIWPKDAVAYLLEKGWTPLGDPRHPRTSWLDPTKPDHDIEERRKVGEKILPNKAKEDVYQVHITPRAFPTSLEMAVQEQLIRDRSTKG